MVTVTLWQSPGSISWGSDQSRESGHSGVWCGMSHSDWPCTRLGESAACAVYCQWWRALCTCCFIPTLPGALKHVVDMSVYLTRWTALTCGRWPQKAPQMTRYVSQSHRHNHWCGYSICFGLNLRFSKGTPFWRPNFIQQVRLHFGWVCHPIWAGRIDPFNLRMHTDITTGTDTKPKHDDID